MLNFYRFRAGDYRSNFEGASLRIVREGSAYWALYLGTDFAEAYATKSAAMVAANVLVGFASPTPVAKAQQPVAGNVGPRTAKPAKLPAIMHNPKGLYIFGLDEICAMLARSRECDPSLPGLAREHTSQRGKRGYFVDALAASDFWQLCSEEIPGTPALCLGEGKKFEITL